MTMPLFEIDNKKCKRCYACVRICPVKSIKFEANQDFPQIVESRCIGCGHCTKVCKPNAIVFYDSKPETKALLQSGRKVAAIVSPSISGEFGDITDYRKFVEMIRALGFSYVNEVSFGVDLVAWKYKNLFDEFHGKYYIMANCPAIVAFVEKYYPELISNLAPVISPMAATAKVIHGKFGKDVSVVYIGPCVAAKAEARRYDGDATIDAVLTFVELRELFEEFGISESKLEYSDFDAPLGYKGSLEPLPNGLLQAADISEDLLTGSVITTKGRNSVIEALKQFNSSIDFIKKHFNLYYNHGCLLGPGTSKGAEKFVRRTLVTDYANKRLRNFDLKEWETNMNTFRQLDFSRTYQEDDQRIPFPSEEKIQEILRILHKPNKEDELGCTACGYDSCRDLAIAIASNLAKEDMCVNFALHNRQEYIKKLKIINEKLSGTQAALRESEKKARNEQQLAQEATDTISAMLHKITSGIVIVDEKLKIIKANRSFIEMLGEDAKAIDEVIPGLAGADLKTLLPYSFYNLFNYILENNSSITNHDVPFGKTILNVSAFPIRKNKTVGAIVRDMSLPEIRKEEVLKRVSEVIDKNLEMVQKIGFLLGEGASETEKMLNSIIEFYKSGED